jgi:hypothetical protein
MPHQHVKQTQGNYEIFFEWRLDGGKGPIAAAGGGNRPRPEKKCPAALTSLNYRPNSGVLSGSEAKCRGVVQAEAR